MFCNRLIIGYLVSVAPHQPRMDWQMWFAALILGHAMDYSSNVSTADWPKEGKLLIS